jgi:hypothetical protein
MDSLGSEKIAKREDSSIDPARNDTRGTIEFLGLSELRIADQTCLEPTFLCPQGGPPQSVFLASEQPNPRQYRLWGSVCRK